MTRGSAGMTNEKNLHESQQHARQCACMEDEKGTFIQEGKYAMRLYLINPSNPLVSIVRVKDSRWNRFRVWKPLSLMVLAGLTPSEWDVSIIDENFGAPDYSDMPRPDLVGITAFTSQANRAYEVAAHFRELGVPVVMGGIHATMCLDEVMDRVDSVVTREAEAVWRQVLVDARHGCLKPRYDGGLAEVSDIPAARHDLLTGEYAFGAVQTTRGCPLNCSFCSVTAFNGAHYRMRPIEDVVREFRLISEKRVLVVDDNLGGYEPKTHRPGQGSVSGHGPGETEKRMGRPSHDQLCR